MPTTKLNRYTVHYATRQEYHVLKREIFNQAIYYFETDNETPVIIDGGAHIGLATIYFKSLYHKAKIIAIEPVSDSFQLLEQNLFANQLEEVELVKAALWHKEISKLRLYLDKTQDKWQSTAGIMPGSWLGTQTSQSFYTKTILLSKLIQNLGPVDLIKLDIEGAEGRVIKEALPQLKQVKQLLIEYHPTTHQIDKTLNIPLTKLVNLLESAGFNVEVSKNSKIIDPVKTKNSLVMIHATR